MKASEAKQSRQMLARLHTTAPVSWPFTVTKAGPEEEGLWALESRATWA